MHLSAILLNGLRDYGTEPQIWDGDDSACEHRWGNEQQKTIAIADKRGAEHTSERDFLMDGKQASQGSFCQYCNAWRGSLGLEPTPALYIEHLVQIFREVRRVLRKDGTCWIVVGDSYCANAGQRKTTDKAGIKQQSNVASTGAPSRSVPGLKPKDLIGIPYMLAFALRDDGWYWRSMIRWAKKAPMPESTNDRPTSAVEEILFLSKSERYYYDKYAVEEASVSDHKSGNGYARDFQLSKGGRGQDAEWDNIDGTRNMRNFLLLGPEPFKGKHYAAYPSRIPEIAIAAGTSEKGCCSKCGAPWKRVVEKHESVASTSGFLDVNPGKGASRSGGFKKQETDAQYLGKWFETDLQSSGARILKSIKEKRDAGAAHDAPFQFGKTIGWQPTCKCNADIIPATVLDPFLGSGTTAKTANEMIRNAIGIDLKTDYTDMAEGRIGSGLLWSVERA